MISSLVVGLCLRLVSPIGGNEREQHQRSDGDIGFGLCCQHQQHKQTAHDECGIELVLGMG